jgi:ADP-ribosyl-[dinitrogen reductase] hydrolase
MEKIERYRGSLLGLAAGDALGAAVEFMERGTFDPVEDMDRDTVHGNPPGSWTDDTSMALCLAESLIECDGMNLADQLERYVRWWREGHMSSTGECFDIGNTTSEALRNFERTGDPHSGPTDPNKAGNGSIMRLAPVPLFFATDPAEAVERSGESSLTTHGAPEAVDACRYFGTLVAGAANGIQKDELLSEEIAPPNLAPKVAEVAGDSFKRKGEDEIRGSGYVVESLEAALWAFHNSGSFEEGALLAVNLGDDADTTGAVYGQIAGAFYGESSIPESWREKLTFREKIEGFADDLLRLSRNA